MSQRKNANTGFESYEKHQAEAINRQKRASSIDGKAVSGRRRKLAKTSQATTPYPNNEASSHQLNLPTFMPQIFSDLETAFSNLNMNDLAWLNNNHSKALPIPELSPRINGATGTLDPRNDPLRLMTLQPRLEQPFLSNNTTPAQGSVSTSGVKLSAGPKPRPIKPDIRHLLEFEIELLRKFFASQFLTQLPLNSDEDVENWYHSWDDERGFPIPGVSKAWGVFLRSNITQDQLKTRSEAVDEQEMAMKQYEAAMRTWRKNIAFVARNDPNAQAAQTSQRAAWGTTEEERRENWRVEGLEGRDAEDIKAIQPSRRMGGVKMMT